MKRHLRLTVRILWCLLLFLLPLRWCLPTIACEQPNFPLQFAEWLFFTAWPPLLAPALIGAALLLSLAAWPSPPPFRKAPPAWIIPLLACSPLLFGLAGLVHTTEWGFAANWYWHFYSAALLAAGLWWTSRHDDRLLPWALHTLAASTALAAAEGWRQHFGGLAEQYRDQLEFARESGTPLTRQLAEKMQQTRSYGHFVDPNSYAAHLLLTGPLLLASIHRLAERCSRPRALRLILLPAAAILLLGALWFSGSRGALVGLAVGLAIAAWMLVGDRLGKTARVALVLLAVLAAAVLAAAASRLSRRGLETASIRLEYNLCCLRVFRLHPAVGAGLGEFFPWHMRLKPWQADEARDPHSLPMAMLAQCGVFGALDALLRLGLPFLLALGLLRRFRHADRFRTTAALAGWCAWTSHALVQFNDQILATNCIAAAIGLLAFPDAPPPPDDTAAPRRPWLPAALLAVAALAGLWSLHRTWYEIQLQACETELRKGPGPGLSYGLRELYEEHPSQYSPARMALDLALHQGNEENALDAARALVQRTPHRASSWLHLAKCELLFHGATDDARDAIARAETWYPTSPLVCYYRAIASLPGLSAAERRALLAWSPVLGENHSDVAIGIVLHPPEPQPGRPFRAPLKMPPIIERLNALALHAATPSRPQVYFQLSEQP